MNDTTPIGLTLLSREDARVLLVDLPLDSNAVVPTTWRSWAQNDQHLQHFMPMPRREEVESCLSAGAQVIFAEQSAEHDLMHLWIIFPTVQGKWAAQLDPDACRAAALQWLQPRTATPSQLSMMTLPLSLHLSASAHLTLELGFATATLSIIEALLLADHLRCAGAGHMLDELTPVGVFSNGTVITLEGHNQTEVWLSTHQASCVAQQLERLARPALGKRRVNARHINVTLPHQPVRMSTRLGWFGRFFKHS